MCRQLLCGLHHPTMRTDSRELQKAMRQAVASSSRPQRKKLVRSLSSQYGNPQSGKHPRLGTLTSAVSLMLSTEDACKIKQLFQIRKQLSIGAAAGPAGQRIRPPALTVGNDGFPTRSISGTDATFTWAECRRKGSARWQRAHRGARQPARGRGSFLILRLHS